MKVEIEASDLVRLKTDLSEYKAKLQEVTCEINQLSEDELKKKAIRLAEKIFYEAMRLACKEIGFEFLVPWCNLDFNSLQKALDTKVYEKPEIKFKLTLQFTKELKKAFIETVKIDYHEK
jgi:hypothetical protein